MMFQKHLLKILIFLKLVNDKTSQAGALFTLSFSFLHRFWCQWCEKRNKDKADRCLTLVDNWFCVLQHRK